MSKQLVKSKSTQIQKKKQLKEESDSEDENINVNANIFNTKTINQNINNVPFCSDSEGENVVNDVGFFGNVKNIKSTNEKQQSFSSNDNKDVELHDGSEDEKQKKVSKNTVNYINKIEDIIKKKICNCIFDSQTAYIVDSLECNEIDEKRYVVIGDYLNDKKMQKDVINGKIFLVCEKNEELIKYESDKRKNHFKHKHCEHGNMSEWHKKWQSEFKETEAHIGNRWADSVCGDYVLEFQHSPITKELVDARSKNYKDNGNFSTFGLSFCEFALFGLNFV